MEKIETTIEKYLSAQGFDISLDFKSQGLQKAETPRSKFSSSEYVENSQNNKSKMRLDSSNLNRSINSNDDLNLFLFGGKKIERSMIRDEIELN